MELRAGIVDGGWTPWAAQQAARVVVHLTPQDGENLFAQMSGLAPSKSSLDCLPKALSERWEAGRVEWEGALRSAETVPDEALAVFVSLDGVRLPMSADDDPTKWLATKMIGRQEQLYGRVPRQAAFDGGFASRANLDDIKTKGVADVCFSKGRGIAITEMVKSSWVFRKLRNFRAGIEGCISFLKRCFDLTRCLWSGLESFGAYALRGDQTSARGNRGQVRPHGARIAPARAMVRSALDDRPGAAGVVRRRAESLLAVLDLEDGDLESAARGAEGVVECLDGEDQSSFVAWACGILARVKLSQGYPEAAGRAIARGRTLALSPHAEVVLAAHEALVALALADRPGAETALAAATVLPELLSPGSELGRLVSRVRALLAAGA